jgi:hypothetical protein
MNTLALKLVLTPLLIGAASLAGRRWGPAVSGWLVGLPLTSGPVAFFLALGLGSRFASAAAAGTLAGTISQCVFCLAYSWLAARYSAGWPPAVLGGTVGFAAATIALTSVPLPLAVLFPIVVLALALTLRLLPTGSLSGRVGCMLPSAPSSPSPAPAASPPAWDLPARMAAATAIVLALTVAASALGPRLTGLLAPFPVYATILAVFAHRQLGPAAAVRVLSGLLYGLFGFAAFFLVIAALIEHLGIGPAFALAILLDLASQGLSLRFVRNGVSSPLSTGAPPLPVGEPPAP